MQFLITEQINVPEVIDVIIIKMIWTGRKITHRPFLWSTAVNRVGENSLILIATNVPFSSPRTVWISERRRTEGVLLMEK